MPQDQKKYSDRNPNENMVVPIDISKFIDIKGLTDQIQYNDEAKKDWQYYS